MKKNHTFSIELVNQKFRGRHFKVTFHTLNIVPLYIHEGFGIEYVIDAAHSLIESHPSVKDAILAAQSTPEPVPVNWAKLKRESRSVQVS